MPKLKGEKGDENLAISIGLILYIIRCLCNAFPESMEAVYYSQ